MNGLPRIAVVVPALSAGGGVSVVGAFLYRALVESRRYEPSLVSLATSYHDPASVRLLDPSSWLRGVRVTGGAWEGLPYRHVGARLVEIELQRYRPRAALTRLLEEHALIQVVAGAPAWGLAASRVRRPVALQVATRVAEERRSRLSTDGLANAWRLLMTRLTSRIELRALRHLDAVFVENLRMLEWLHRHMSPEKVHFAPPGVDTERFQPGTPAAGGGDYLLCVGRFSDPRKRVDLLFRAYAELRRSLLGAPRLVLAGNGAPTSDHWALARSLGIAEQVEFKENVPVEGLADLYRGASLFVLASDEEGLGLVILEAMASGLPVVSTDCGGPSTSVIDGATGFLVPCGDAAALAARIRELLSHPDERRAMGERARQRAVERFSLDATARPFLEYYNRRLENGSGPGDGR